MTDAFSDVPSEGPARPRVRRILLVTVLLAALAVAGLGGFAAWALGGSGAGQPVRVVVPEGASGAEIGRILDDAGVIRSSFAFRFVARIRGVAGDLKPGAYDLRTGLGVSGAIAAIRKGVPLKVTRITVPEGETVIEIAELVGTKTHISGRAFLKAVRSGRHRIAILPKRLENLEGLFFPKTYDVVEDMTADDVVEMLLRQFETEVRAIDLSRAKRLGLDPYEAVIVASLVEREARAAKDRPKVASVIYNRLDRPMRLQIDATVQYAILLETGRYKRRLTFDDYEDVRSPYNTYLIDGLPPTPIASPGLAAIRAALEPADTDFFYYVLKAGSSEHCFARTAQEFQACKRSR